MRRGSLGATGPPFEAVLALDTGRHAGRHAAAMVLALSAHGLLAMAAVSQHVPGDSRAPPKQEIAATVEIRPAPPAPAPSPAPEPSTRAPSRTRSRTPPAPAQAGKVVARAQDGPADLTGFAIAEGSGESYAGGLTSSTGTSKVAAASEARPGGTGNGGRAAMPLDSDWACPWPDEAQDSDQTEARVTIRAQVGVDGRALHVEVLSAPPGGFAEAARECVEREAFHPAQDRSGRAVTGATPPITVHFVR